LSKQVTIAAAYELPARRYPEFDTLELFRAVLKGALASWPVGPQDIDGLLTTPAGTISGYDTYIHSRLISELGIHARLAQTMNLGGGSHLAMVNYAAMAIREGRANAVLCISAGKMFRPGMGAGEAMARAVSDGNLEVPYGTYIPALYALTASEFMVDRNATAEDLARVAVSARKWALLNPKARMYNDGPLTVEAVLASRMVVTPFHYLDCSVPTDGGGAVLVTRSDLGLRWAKQPAYIRGYGECHQRGTVSDSGSLIETGAVVAGRVAFERAGLRPRDSGAAQLYDAFSSTPLILLENLGLCERGEAAAFVQSGAIDPGGVLPVNTYGGLLSFGHTGDSSGMSLLTAGSLQALGEAGPTQVDNAAHVLIHAYGGVMFSHTTMILGRDA
jgi:acetyl-CoA acetyltransferase